MPLRTADVLSRLVQRAKVSLHQMLHQTLANWGNLCHLLSSLRMLTMIEWRAERLTQTPVKQEKKKALPAVFADKASDVSRAGVEPTTFGFGGRCGIQLRFGHKTYWRNTLQDGVRTLCVSSNSKLYSLFKPLNRDTVPQPCHPRVVSHPGFTTADNRRVEQKSNNNGSQSGDRLPGCPPVFARGFISIARPQPLRARSLCRSAARGSRRPTSDS